MRHRGQRLTAFLAPALLLALLLTGCAKRPATTAVSAPAPTPPPAAPAATPSPSRAVTEPPRPAPPGGAGEQRAAVRPSPAEFAETGDLKDVHFDFDKYEIRPGDAKVLDANAVWLKSNPDQVILIEGHCDERGTNEYNIALGDRRAKATTNYLVAQGVPQNRISVISYGEERPLCTAHNEDCWAKNRRAHFLVKRR